VHALRLKNYTTLRGNSHAHSCTTTVSADVQAKLTEYLWCCGCCHPGRFVRARHLWSTLRQVADCRTLDIATGDFRRLEPPIAGRCHSLFVHVAS